MEGVSWIMAGCLEFPKLGSVGYIESSKFIDGIVFPSLHRKFHLIENLHRNRAIADLFLSPFDEYMDKLKTDSANLSAVAGPVNPDRCKIWYVRYANNFFVGISGTYKDAVYIRNLIEDFLNKTLLLNEDQLKISHLVKNITGGLVARGSAYPSLMFLGYNIRVSALRPELIAPKKLIKEWLISKGLANQEGKGKYVGKWIFLPDTEIILRFSNVLKDLVEYYKLVKNSRKQLHEGIYIINFSLLHTLAAKHRMKLSKVIKKYELSPPGRRPYDFAKVYLKSS
jgi:hypothetical protein